MREFRKPRLPGSICARAMSHALILSRHVVGTNGRNLTMTGKLDPFAAAPALMKTWQSASLAIVGSLEPGLVELVEIRASQINGCANCLNMHTAWAREREVRASSASTCSRPGARRLATPSASAQRSAGPMR